MVSKIKRDKRKDWRGRMLLAVVFVLLIKGATLRAELYGVEGNTGMLYSISAHDGSLSPIGNTGVLELSSLELHDNGFLYGFTLGEEALLYRINPDNAHALPIGSLGIGFVFEGGLAIASDGRAYGANQYNATAPRLFTVDLNTGAGTRIATISGGSHDINGLSWRSDGKLVGLDRETNSLLEIDPVTAVSTIITAIDPGVGVVGGMTILGNSAYFSTGRSGSGSNSLYSFDPFTGAYEIVGSFSPTITSSGISGLAAPEPGTVFLLGVGGLMLGKRRRKYR